mmetsp:Transcript_42163/g.98375  ORF Transcript_42163/g.98375 Transcript_42163/m.98375 type:complete len:373 (+) Transcript_42163:125-1243(+)
MALSKPATVPDNEADVWLTHVPPELRRPFRPLVLLMSDAAQIASEFLDELGGSHAKLSSVKSLDAGPENLTAVGLLALGSLIPKSAPAYAALGSIVITVPTLTLPLQLPPHLVCVNIASAVTYCFMMLLRWLYKDGDAHSPRNFFHQRAVAILSAAFALNAGMAVLQMGGAGLLHIPAETVDLLKAYFGPHLLAAYSVLDMVAFPVILVGVASLAGIQPHQEEYFRTAIPICIFSTAQYATFMGHGQQSFALFVGALAILLFHQTMEELRRCERRLLPDRNTPVMDRKRPTRRHADIFKMTMFAMWLTQAGLWADNIPLDVAETCFASVHAIGLYNLIYNITRDGKVARRAQQQVRSDQKPLAMTAWRSGGA